MRRILRLRTMILAIAICSLLFAYVGSYVRISRRGMREAGPYGLDGFLYISASEASASKNISHHYLLAIFYAPLNLVDRKVFGGPQPVECIMTLHG